MFGELLGQAVEFFDKPQKKKSRVVVIGDLALDRFVSGSVDRISPEAPVPVLVVEKTTEELGCAGNVIRNLATLSDQFPELTVDVFGVVGSDPTGDRLVGLLRSLGSHVECHLVRENQRPTTEKTRFLASSHHQLLRVDSERTQKIDPETQRSLGQSLESKLEGASMIVIQDYAKGLLGEDFLQRLIKLTRSKGVKSIVDPNRNTPPHAYRGSWLLTPNIAEAEALLGVSLEKGADTPKVESAVLKLRQNLEITIPMITRSHHGLTWANDPAVGGSPEFRSLPALARTVFDVTGAGDTLVAALAASLSAGATVDVAAAVANAAASVVVGKAGTATVTGQEILEELKRQKAQ